MNSNPSPTLRRSDVARGNRPRPAAPRREQPLAAGQDHVVHAKVVDEETREPLSNAEYEIVDPEGQVVFRGQTDWQGIGSRSTGA